MCRKIVLAATSPGALMIPGDPRVLWKLATPRRYIDKDFMRRVAPEIYGGAFRNNPDILAAHAKAMTGTTEKGYLYQLIAMAGWTSLPWLWTLKQPALILAGRDDPIVPPVNARLMARLMPNARLKLLDDGHLFLVTSPVSRLRSSRRSSPNEKGGRCKRLFRRSPVPEFTLSDLPRFVGKELGVSSWVTVDQSRIDQFAECSGDRQWIHVDVERAKRESPYRAPIAHGYLTLSLVAPLQMEIGAVPADAGQRSTMDSTRCASSRRSRQARACDCASR